MNGRFVRTEGTGGRPPVFHRGPPSERPPPPTGADAPQGAPAPPSPPSAPTAPEPRAAPAGPSRPWRWSLAALVLLCLVGAGLWRLAGKSVAPSERFPVEPLTLAAQRPDAGPPLYATAPPDGGAFDAPSFADPLAYVPPTSLQEKGQSMRNPSRKNPPTPQEQEPARDGGSRPATALLGLTLACNLVTGCASVPVGPPDTQPCPPGAREVKEERYGIEMSPKDLVYLPGHLKGNDFEHGDYVTVSEGRNFVTFQGSRWPMPKGTKIIGDFILRDRLYGRLTELELPDKTRLPFCGLLWDFEDDKEGLKIHPGSRPGALRVFPVAWVTPEMSIH